MSCRRWNQAVADHACGSALDAAGAAHLSACAACRHRAATLARALRDAEEQLRGALTLAASADFTARLSRRLRDQPARSPARMTATLRWSAVAAAALLLAVLAAASLRRVPVPAHSGPALVSAPPPAAAPPARIEPRAAAAAPLPGARGLSRTPPGKRPAPIVIVPPDQDRAFGHLRALVRAGRLDEILPERPAPADLVIEPLIVPDLSVPERLSESDGSPGRPDVSDKRSSR